MCLRAEFPRKRNPRSKLCANTSVDSTIPRKQKAEIKGNEAEVEEEHPT